MKGPIEVSKATRNANHLDRPCDLCRQPMIGILREMGEKTPRKVCHPCGGKAIPPEERGS